MQFGAEGAAYLLSGLLQKHRAQFKGKDFENLSIAVKILCRYTPAGFSLLYQGRPGVIVIPASDRSRSLVRGPRALPAGEPAARAGRKQPSHRPANSGKTRPRRLARG